MLIGQRKASREFGTSPPNQRMGTTSCFVRVKLHDNLEVIYIIFEHSDEIVKKFFGGY